VPDDGAPDPASAAAAAAAEVAGVTSESPGADEKARRAEWGRKFAETFKDVPGLEGGAIGSIVASIEWKVLSRVYAGRASRMKPPRYIVVRAEDIATPLTMLAMAWEEQLRRWGLDLAEVEPWMAIVGGTVGLAVALTMATTTTVPPPAPESPPGATP